MIRYTKPITDNAIPDGNLVNTSNEQQTAEIQTAEIAGIFLLLIETRIIAAEILMKNCPKLK